MEEKKQEPTELKLGKSQKTFDDLKDTQDIIYGLEDKPPVRDSIFCCITTSFSNFCGNNYSYDCYWWSLGIGL